MPSGSDSAGVRELRRDAVANRDRVLRAADAAFAEHGLEAPVEQIARRAGVGVGTLYRRFPTKASLIEAIFEDHVDELAEAAHDALAADDPWVGLRGFLEQAVALQARNRGFAEIVSFYLRDEQLVAKARARVAPPLRGLIERAQAAGALRADVVYEDVSMLLWTSGRVVDATREVAPDFWRRQLALALDGLRAAGATPLPEPPLTGHQHLRATERIAPRMRLAPSATA